MPIRNLRRKVAAIYLTKKPYKFILGENIWNVFRVYLKTPNVTGSEKFLR